MYILLILSPYIYVAADQANIAVVDIPPFVRTLKGLSFRHRRLIIYDRQAKNFGDIDLIWDPQNGLAANNRKLEPPFNGDGGMRLIGTKTLAELRDVPDGAYETGITPARKMLNDL